MIRANSIFALMLFCLGLCPAAHSKDASPIPEVTLVGTNTSRWIGRDCRLEVHRFSGRLVVVSFQDRGSIYNIWMNGEELRPAVFGNGWLHSGALEFESYNKSTGMNLYRSKEAGSSISEEGWSADIVLEDSGEISSFEFVHHKATGGTEFKVANRILCRNLRPL